MCHNCCNLSSRFVPIIHNIILIISLRFLVTGKASEKETCSNAQAQEPVILRRTRNDANNAATLSIEDSLKGKIDDKKEAQKQEDKKERVIAKVSTNDNTGRMSLFCCCCE